MAPGGSRKRYTCGLLWLRFCLLVSIFFQCSIEASPFSTSSSTENKSLLDGVRDNGQASWNPTDAVSANFRRSIAIITAEEAPLAYKATDEEIAKARKIVKAAQQVAAQRNAARLAQPRRNQYKWPPTGQSGLATKRDRNSTSMPSDHTVPDYLEITPEVDAAAALITEVDAVTALNGSRPQIQRQRAQPFWMQDIKRMGSVPWGNEQNYKVFRNVRDYGAKGNGIADDTEAIQNAISDGRRCGEKCNGSTTKNAIVYFPPGRYRTHKTITAFFGTQLIGDANDWPILIGSSAFVDRGVIFSTDEYVGGYDYDGDDKEWYKPTANFYRQIRNFRIDISETPADGHHNGLHYQVAQATSLQFIEFIAKTGTTQVSIFSENGSGGHMSDLVFTGGSVCMFAGNQQYTAQRIKFNGCKTAVNLIWDWGWTWKSIEITNAEIGFSLVNDNPNGDGRIGSFSILDSKFANVGTAVQIMPPSTEPGTGTTGITVDNVAFSSISHWVQSTDGVEYMKDSPSYVDTWTLGPIYSKSPDRGINLGWQFETKRDTSLTGRVDGLDDSSLKKRPFFERPKPQYEDMGYQDFIHIKDFASGDGKDDDTLAFQTIVATYGKLGNVIFIDAGTYMIRDTITIPVGARIVGEAWPQIVAYGPNFSDEDNPRPLFRVGEDGDKGSVEIQDLIFTTKGATAGAIMVEWNIRADDQGSAGMWDCHVRIGGAIGTDLTPKECPALTSGVNTNCNAGSLMMHITPKASGYFENVWLWVADHMIDDPDLNDDNNKMTQISIYVGRGLLVESQEPTWLYGTSAEHAVFYQYNINSAKRVFAGMVQTESPYFQPTPKPPAPLESSVGKFRGDPDYSSCSSNSDGCDESWAIIVRNSDGVTIVGAGLYSWFSTYTQECVDTRDCQKTLVLLEKNKDVRFQNLITIGATNMLLSDGRAVPSKDNLAVEAHPYWSQITLYDPIENYNMADSCAGWQNSSWHVLLPDGHYGPPANWANGLEWHKVFDAYSIYVTIVNGSPYNFSKIYQHANQLTIFDWHDVPRGQSVQNQIEYVPDGAKFFVDDKGEARYEISGPGQTFEIRARNNKSDDQPLKIVYHFGDLPTIDIPQFSDVDNRGRGRGNRAVNFVLAGDDDRGYYTSVNPPVAWMHEILDVIGDRKLKHVCMIGSHDAGMFKRTGGWMDLVPDGSVLTQGLDFEGQLIAGSRYFDLRPVIGNGGEYVAGHYNVPRQKGTSPYGGNGERIEEIVNQINRFTNEHPELIVLYLSHGFNTDKDWNDQGYPNLTDEEWDGVFDILEKLNHRCKGLEGQITDYTMRDLIGGGEACVIVVSDAGKVRPDQGIYSPGAQWDWLGDHWSETFTMNEMATDQLSYMYANRPNLGVNATEDRWMVMQWILTIEPSGLITEFTIEDVAINLPYDAVFWKAFNGMMPWSYPNVVLMDYVGVVNVGAGARGNVDINGELRALSLAINMGIASQNCHIGGATKAG